MHIIGDIFRVFSMLVNHLDNNLTRPLCALQGGIVRKRNTWQQELYVEIVHYTTTLDNCYKNCKQDGADQFLYGRMGPGACRIPRRPNQLFLKGCEEKEFFSIHMYVIVQGAYFAPLSPQHSVLKWQTRQLDVTEASKLDLQNLNVYSFIIN